MPRYTQPAAPEWCLGYTKEQKSGVKHSREIGCKIADPLNLRMWPAGSILQHSGTYSPETSSNRPAENHHLQKQIMQRACKPLLVQSTKLYTCPNISSHAGTTKRYAFPALISLLLGALNRMPSGLKQGGHLNRSSKHCSRKSRYLHWQSKQRSQSAHTVFARTVFARAPRKHLMTRTGCPKCRCTDDWGPWTESAAAASCLHTARTTAAGSSQMLPFLPSQHCVAASQWQCGSNVMGRCRWPPASTRQSLTVHHIQPRVQALTAVCTNQGKRIGFLAVIVLSAHLSSIRLEPSLCTPKQDKR
jgi:hypothetical protein